jgi:hypothetical protein
MPSFWGWNFYWDVKKYKSPGSDEIPAELFQAGDKTLLFEIHKLTRSISNEKALLDE